MHTRNGGNRPVDKRRLYLVKAFIWPVSTLILFLTFFIIFRNPISSLIGRVSNADLKYSKVNVEFRFAAIAEQGAQLDLLQSQIQAVVAKAASSENQAILLGWRYSEFDTKRLLATTGWNNGQFTSLPEAINTLISLGVIAPNVASIVRAASDAHDKIVSLSESDNIDNAAAVVNTIQLLRAISGVSHAEPSVLAANLTLYSEAQCKTAVPGVTGVLLQSNKIEGIEITPPQVFPTTRTDYTVGEKVSWRWEIGGRVLGATWFKDQKTGKVKQAFGSSYLFVGGNLDDLE